MRKYHLIFPLTAILLTTSCGYKFKNEVNEEYAAFINGISTKITRSVIEIRSNFYYDYFGDEEELVESHRGNGIIVSQTEAGYFVITARNIVDTGYRFYSRIDYEVYDYNYGLYNARLVASSDKYNLSLVYFKKGRRSLEYMPYTISEKVSGGDLVATVGSKGYQLNAITVGRSVKYDGSTYFGSTFDYDVLFHDTDTSLYIPGSALVNENLELAGINVYCAQSEDSDTGYMTETIVGEQIIEFYNSVRNDSHLPDIF